MSNIFEDIYIKTVPASQSSILEDIKNLCLNFSESKEKRLVEIFKIAGGDIETYKKLQQEYKEKTKNEKELFAEEIKNKVFQAYKKIGLNYIIQNYARFMKSLKILSENITREDIDRLIDYFLYLKNKEKQERLTNNEQFFISQFTIENLSTKINNLLLMIPAKKNNNDKKNNFLEGEL